MKETTDYIARNLIKLKRRLESLEGLVDSQQELISSTVPRVNELEIKAEILGETVRKHLFGKTIEKIEEHEKKVAETMAKMKEARPYNGSFEADSNPMPELKKDDTVIGANGTKFSVQMVEYENPTREDFEDLVQIIERPIAVSLYVSDIQEIWRPTLISPELKPIN